jgi:RecA-family ATPase
MSSDGVAGPNLLGESLDLAAAFATAPPQRDDVLVGLEPGNVMILAGLGGKNKSTLALQIAFDLALAREHSLETGLVPRNKSQRTLSLFFEEFCDDLHRRAHPIGARLSPAEREQCASAISLRSMKRQSPALQLADGTIDQNIADALAHMIEASRARLVSFDPLVRFSRADVCSDAAMAQLIVALESIGAKTGAAILVVHHASKTSTWNGNSASALALKGSTALVDLPRCVGVIGAPTDDAARQRGVDPKFTRVVTIAKANYRAEEEIWYRRADDGVLEIIDAPNAKTSAEPAKTNDKLRWEGLD